MLIPLGFAEPRKEDLILHSPLILTLEKLTCKFGISILPAVVLADVLLAWAEEGQVPERARVFLLLNKNMKDLLIRKREWGQQVYERERIPDWMLIPGRMHILGGS